MLFLIYNIAIILFKNNQISKIIILDLSWLFLIIYIIGKTKRVSKNLRIKNKIIGKLN